MTHLGWEGCLSNLLGSSTPREGCGKRVLGGRP